MVHFIFIRHGESTDNLRGVWAGWKDSALSNHGMRQAEALAEDLAKTRLSAIYCSDLVRARRTAEAIQEKQLQHVSTSSTTSSCSTSSSTPTSSTPTLLFQSSTLLREQNFGAGEGMKFAKKEQDMTLEAHFAKGKFPALYTRQQCFPGGESLDGVAKRAEKAWKVLLERHVPHDGSGTRASNQSEAEVEVVAVVSHGLFLAELIAVIIRKDGEFRGDLDVRNLRGMKNTAWTKLDVRRKAPSPNNPHPISWALNIRVLGANRHAHLSNLHRQKGGIGSSAHDPAQRDIRAFLGGGATGGAEAKAKPASKPKPKSSSTSASTGKTLRAKPY